jgi:hypothetical protein
MINGKWDVRCPPALRAMFPKEKRRGYYYKITRKQAKEIVEILAEAYGVAAPIISDEMPPRGFNGAYRRGRREIEIHPLGHMKTTFHEFYHYLDEATLGREVEGGHYLSDDCPGMHKLTPITGRTGSISLAWQFADRMFNALREIDA